jgi:hypothetical protein
MADSALRQTSWATIDGGWRERWEYQADREPIVVEDHASHGSHRTPTLIQQELAAFRAAVQILAATGERDQVLAHLSVTRFVVVATGSEPDNLKCRRAALTLLSELVTKYGGLIHVETEGFYIRNTSFDSGFGLLLPTPGLRYAFDELPETHLPS